MNLNSRVQNSNVYIHENDLSIYCFFFFEEHTQLELRKNNLKCCVGEETISKWFLNNLYKRSYWQQQLTYLIMLTKQKNKSNTSTNKFLFLGSLLDCMIVLSNNESKKKFLIT